MDSLVKPFFKLSETINCPICKESIVLYDAPRSKFTTCSYCFSYLQIISSELSKLNKELKKPEKTPVLKLGSVANIHDNEFKVVAYLEKREVGTIYCWREYILTSQSKGYVTLSEFDGHWNLIGGEKFVPNFKTPISYGVSVGYNDVEYTIFNKYSPIVTSMLGELDWDVVNEKVNATEYIAPPYMVVKEITGTTNLSTDYYIGEYLEPQVIANIFNIDLSLLPEKVGVGANQPSKEYDRWTSSLKITGIAIVLVLLLHLLFGIIKPNKELVNSDFLIAYDPKTGGDSFKSFITPSFYIDDESSNIEFEIASAVDNNWLETTIVLVNEGDNRTWEVSKGIEFYHGYEDGERWSEGSTKETILLSEIPRGKYHLNVYPSSGDVYRNNLYIKATSNVTMWRNTLLTILLLCIYPAICWYLMRKFEKGRWNNSDYSPFVNED